MLSNLRKFSLVQGCEDLLYYLLEHWLFYVSLFKLQPPWNLFVCLFGLVQSSSHFIFCIRITNWHSFEKDCSEAILLLWIKCPHMHGSLSEIPLLSLFRWQYYTNFCSLHIPWSTSSHYSLSSVLASLGHLH